MRAVVLADTHSRPLPPRAVEELEHADLILHAGDVVDGDYLAALGQHALVHAVLGNNDHGLRGVLPETLVVELDGVRVAMIHDTGARTGREARVKRRFPHADIVVFGHSHIPWDAEGLDGQWLFNPGSATQRRAQPQCTLGVLDIAAGRVCRRELVLLG